MTLSLLTIATTFLSIQLYAFTLLSSAANGVARHIIWFVGTDLTRYLEIALDFKAWCIGLLKSLSQLSDLAFKIIDVLKKFILLGHVVTQLIVD